MFNLGQTIATNDDLTDSLCMKKMNLPQRNKIFMMHLEQIHHAFASAISFECGVEWKRQELCAALSRDACRQMLVISKLGWGRRQWQLLNCGGVQIAGRKQCLSRTGMDSDSGLSFARFLYWHLEAVTSIMSIYSNTLRTADTNFNLSTAGAS